MTRLLAAPVVLAVVILANGCGGGASVVSNPFTTAAGGSAGPGSGLWGDTAWDHHGDHIGCISGRRYGQAITVHNASKRTVTIVGVEGSQPHFRVVERVAAQTRLKPKTNDERIEIGGLASWTRKPLKPVAVPPGRDAFVQLDFLMHDCTLLASGQHLRVPDDVVVEYTDGRGTGRQSIPADIPIVLTRAAPGQAAAYRAHPEAG